jgi:hypothetical protein
MKARLTDLTQKQKFLDAANALECDPSEERFNAALGKIARAKVPPHVKKPTPEKPKG